MSKIDDVKTALAELQRTTGRAVAQVRSSQDEGQLDEVLAMVRDINNQLSSALPAETLPAAGNENVNEATTATD